MKKITMIFCCFAIVSTALEADEPSKTSTGLVIDSSLCTKDVLMTFFPQPVVKAILIKHQIPEGKAQEISHDLSKKSQDVAQIVESKASKMDPNPFNDLSNRDAAVKIFRETLFEIFSQVLKSHGVTKDKMEIQVLLDDMQEAKGKLFVECIKKQPS